MPLTTFGTVTSIDWSRETATTKLYAPDVASFGGVVTEIVNVQYTDSMKQTAFTTKDLIRVLPPANQESQREQKLQVKFVDNVTLDTYEVTIPCFDKSTVVFNQNSDVVQFDVNAVLPSANAADGLAQAFEANLVSQDGNPISVSEMRFVGVSS